MNRADFAAKVEWEGGIFEALEYGLHSDDIDDTDQELQDAWSALETAYGNMVPLIGKVERIFDSLGEEE